MNASADGEEARLWACANLDRIRRRLEWRASLRVENSLVASEIADEVVYALEVAIAERRAPHALASWLATILRRRIADQLRKHGPGPIDAGDLADAEYASRDLGGMRDWKERLDEIEPFLIAVLTPRQEACYQALRRCPNLRAAAREAGVRRRDLRRAMARIAHLARRIATEPGDNPAYDVGERDRERRTTS